MALLSVPAQAEPVKTRLGILEVDHGLPTPATRRKLYDELDFQRAVQGVIWAEPAINNALFQRAMVNAGVPNLGAMVYDKRMHPGQETLTPNQSVIYLYDTINLADTGPVVHIVPEAPINAGFFDMWMRPVLDFGTVGPNKGRGDRILILPPGYTGEAPEGYLVPPGPEKEANWLPAPAGSFDVHLRTYVPQKALLDGSYKLPPIVRANSGSD
ncbi:MAG: hypothetical protein CTY15_04840 [Methylocystis sp.]|nr:MAG: hypothetical protein CTY15_04840 [Methylocystis sp.]